MLCAMDFSSVRSLTCEGGLIFWATWFTSCIACLFMASLSLLLLIVFSKVIVFLVMLVYGFSHVPFFDIEYKILMLMRRLLSTKCRTSTASSSTIPSKPIQDCFMGDGRANQRRTRLKTSYWLWPTSTKKDCSQLSASNVLRTG